jgi:hypothetical protein
MTMWEWYNRGWAFRCLIIIELTRRAQTLGVSPEVFLKPYAQQQRRKAQQAGWFLR